MERRLIDAKEGAELMRRKAINYASVGKLKEAEKCAITADMLNDNVHFPTIDAVEVVRCRECKHRKDPFVCPMCGECVAPEGEDWGVHDWAEDDGFCHKGERREPDGE